MCCAMYECSTLSYTHRAAITSVTNEVLGAFVIPQIRTNSELVG